MADRNANTIDLSQVPSMEGYIKGQFPAEDAALNNIVMNMRSRENPLAMYGRLETESGLPALKESSASLSKEIANTEDYIEQVEPDISARTGQSLVTEAQRRGMVGAARQPWIEKLSKLGIGLSRIESEIGKRVADIATKVGLGIKGQEMELEPLKLQYTTLVDRNARLTSGFSVDRQTKLDSLYDKLNRERQLSDQEWQLANEIAAEERAYRRSLESSAAGAGVKNASGMSNADLLNATGSNNMLFKLWSLA